MIITHISKLHSPGRVAAPEFTRTLGVRVFGQAAMRGSALSRGIRFHQALAGFLPDGRLPAESRPYYPFLDALRRDLRARGLNRFMGEVGIESAGMTGRADIVAVGPRRRVIVEVKTCSALPTAPEAAHVAQAALYAAALPGEVAVIVAYVCIQAASVRIFEWQGLPVDLSDLQIAA